MLRIQARTRRELFARVSHSHSPSTSPLQSPPLSLPPFCLLLALPATAHTVERFRVLIVTDLRIHFKTENVFLLFLPSTWHAHCRPHLMMLCLKSFKLLLKSIRYANTQTYIHIQTVIICANPPLQ